LKRQLEYFVALADRVFSKRAYEITAELRRRNLSANFSYKPLSGLAKQLKEASAQNAKKCIIIGSEIENDQLIVKDMATGEQEAVNVDEFLARVSP
jgi:histidyl-tRNA synthetase